MPRIKLYLSIGFVGDEHVEYIDIDDEEWNALTEKEKDIRLNDEWENWSGNYIDGHAVVEPSSD